jgi:UDP-N-acetylmuramoylalanine--D-glutamate ligase
LARSGLAVARALARRGAVVTVTDNKPPAEFRDVLPQLMKEKIGLELGSQRVETFLRHQAIVISPGVPWDLPQLKAARDRMIPVYPEVEAASWFLEGTLVGITGSNGKTTTTSLLGNMLKASGFPTFVGGNIGNALSQAVDHAPPGTRFVTELSSFQLEGIHEFDPHVAVMLNLSPNHLDRHPSLEAYAQAKRQIFRNQQAQDFAVLNADDPWVAGLQSTVVSQPVFFSRTRELANGVFASGGKIYYRTRHLERVLFETRDVTLRGDFNLENVLAATTAACLLGADFAAIRKAVRAFKAVEHRLEFVREIEGVEFYNNSKATSVDATVKSLEAFPRGIHLIMGGKDKGAPYTPLLPLIKDRVREILLIGAAAPVIAQQLAGSADLVQAGDLSTAVSEAFARSRPGDTVLLAPACSSFDQFHDYEERGRVFKELVKQLAKDVSAGRVVRRPESEVRGPGSGVRGLESGILNHESGISEAGSHEPRSQPKSSQPSGAPVQNHEVARDTAPPLLDKEGCPEGGVVDSTHTDEAARSVQSPASAPHRLELSYVYEVDAVEMPGRESQAVPEDQIEVYVSAGAAEILDDEVLPYEARPAAKRGSGVRSPESEVQGTGPGTQVSPKQPKLFNGNDK